MSSGDELKFAQDRLSEALVKTTRITGQLVNEDLGFERSTNPGLGRLLDKQSSRLLDLSRQLIQNAANDASVHGPRIQSAESLDENWKDIVEVLDSLLERADAAIDEHTGVIKKIGPEKKGFAENTAKPKKQAFVPLKNSNLPKPQQRFNKVPKNDETTPFKPLLRSKPHAIIPLDQCQGLETTDAGKLQYDASTMSLKHERLKQQDDSADWLYSAYERSDPVPSLPFESTSAIIVDTPEAVAVMLSQLKGADIIAVDLEHHDTHTYIGLVCLLQISTRTQDWIVDTLKPWREDLQVLNEVFTDPTIIKVLHGSSMDMIWLQRDLGLYMVGLFDTFWASVALNYPRHSLAHLLSRFVNFDAQKQYQLADWRLRPLPKDMLEYARSDTHFLPFIYDNMRNELIDKTTPSEPRGNLIDYVQTESKKEALQRYERPFYDAKYGTGRDGWYHVLIKTPALFSPEQFAVFKAVHQWRDEISRREDESTHFIMPKATIFNVAREMPAEMAKLMGTMSSTGPISQPVRRRLTEFLAIIQKARKEGERGPDMKQFLKSHPATIEYEATRERKAASKGTRQPSIAEVLRREKNNGSGALKSENSQFWGTTISSRVAESTHCKNNPMISVPRLQVLLPQLPQFVPQDQAPSGEQNLPIAETEHQETTLNQEENQNEIIILSDMKASRKRKMSHDSSNGEQTREVTAEHVEGSQAAGSGNNSSGGKTGQALSRNKEKRARKAWKKEQRRKKELELRQKESNEEPFDYAKAPPIMISNDNFRQAGSDVTPFDPYKKSMNAPKGQRKVKRERPGQSITFRT